MDGKQTSTGRQKPDLAVTARKGTFGASEMGGERMFAPR
jgi:hypothetical protein